MLPISFKYVELWSVSPTRLLGQWERRKRRRETFVNSGRICDLSNLCGRRNLEGAQLDKYLDAPPRPPQLIVNHGGR